MSISDRIRTLSRAGLSTSEIAKELGIRYQHAYTVLRAAGMLEAKRGGGLGSTVKTSPALNQPKASLSTQVLEDGGFVCVAEWALTPDGRLTLSDKVTSAVGVYAFAISGVVHYVGVATVGLSQRLYSYTRPGPSQVTNQRLNSLMSEKLSMGVKIEVYVATPPDLEWNGLPVHGSVGLELGLIKLYHLPWNSRSARK